MNLLNLLLNRKLLLQNGLWKRKGKEEEFVQNKSRNRRKEYISELESKVKFLEKENFRLQNLLLGYRSEIMEKLMEILIQS